MKALCLHQPWAYLVAIGAKRYETRSWKTRYRGLERTGLCGHFVGAAYNLVRMSRILAKTAAVAAAAGPRINSPIAAQ